MSEIFSEFKDRFDSEKVKKIIQNVQNATDNDWLVILWQDFTFGVVNIDSALTPADEDLKPGDHLSFGQHVKSFYGPEKLSAIFICRDAKEKDAYRIAQKLTSTKIRKRKVRPTKSPAEDTCTKSQENQENDDCSTEKGIDVPPKKSAATKKAIKDQRKKQTELRGAVAFEKAKILFNKLHEHDKVVPNSPTKNKPDSIPDSNSNLAIPEHDTVNVLHDANQTLLDSSLVSSEVQLNSNPLTSERTVAKPIPSYAAHSSTGTSFQSNSKTVSDSSNSVTSQIHSQFSRTSCTPFEPQRPVSHQPFRNMCGVASNDYQSNNRYTTGDHSAFSHLQFLNSPRPLIQNYYPQTPGMYSQNMFQPRPYPYIDGQYNSLYQSVPIASNDRNAEQVMVQKAPDNITADSDTGNTNISDTNFLDLDNQVHSESISNDLDTCISTNSSGILTSLNSASCLSCAEKDEKIKVLESLNVNLKHQLKDLKATLGTTAATVNVSENSAGSSSRKVGKYVSAPYQVVDGELLPGYQLLAEGSRIAVDADWLKNILHKLRKKDKTCALKILLDCFLIPEQYGIKGGTSKLKQDSTLEPIVSALENFGMYHFKLTSSEVTRALNEKMYSGRKGIQRNLEGTVAKIGHCDLHYLPE